MFVKEIAEYDEFSGECTLVVTDGDYDLLCYCYNGTQPNNMQLKKVESFLCENIMRSLSNEYMIQKTDCYFSYHLQGKVINCVIPEICIGDIIIKLDTPLPKDIKECEFIEFDVLRLDVSLN